MRRTLGLALLGAFVAAVATTLITAAFNVYLINERLTLQGVITFFVSGLVAGFLFTLLLDLGLRSTALIADVSTLSDTVRAQRAVLGMVKDARRHAATIGPLLADDQTARFQVTSVNDARYLTYIRPILEHSDEFRGVQRKPLRWFAQTPGGLAYLTCLKDRRMRQKIRVFVIDDEDVTHMEEDVNDRERVAEYFRNTGHVQTYWIRAKWFKESHEALPYDYALLDSELMITWDGSSVLTFRFVHEKSPELRVFEHLRAYDGKVGTPFHRIAPPKTSRAAPRPKGASAQVTADIAGSVVDGGSR